MGRDRERDDRRRDHRHRHQSRERSRDRRRSRSRSPVHGRSSGQNRDRSRERHREDYRRDSRPDRGDRGDRDRRRDRNRKRNLSPKKNKFLERAQKLGIPTGIPVVDAPASAEPSNLNPASTSRIVDQIKQRKLLWAKPTEGAQGSGPTVAESSSKASPEQTRPGSVQHWAKATFRGDDGSLSAKFRKLMGMKETDVGCKPTDGEDVLAEQDKLFRTLDQEYQKARQSTHTQRGMGLGWGH